MAVNSPILPVGWGLRPLKGLIDVVEPSLDTTVVSDALVSC